MLLDGNNILNERGSLEIYACRWGEAGSADSGKTQIVRRRGSQFSMRISMAELPSSMRGKGFLNSETELWVRAIGHNQNPSPQLGGKGEAGSTDS